MEQEVNADASDLDNESVESDKDHTYGLDDKSEDLEANFSDGDIEYKGDSSGDDKDSFFSYNMDDVEELENTAELKVWKTCCQRAMSTRTWATWM